MTCDEVLEVASALFLVKVIGHKHILATKFPSLGAWRKAKWHFGVVQRGPGGTIGAPMGSHGGQEDKAGKGQVSDDNRYGRGSLLFLYQSRPDKADPGGSISGRQVLERSG